MKQRLLSVLAFVGLTLSAMAQTWTEPVAPVAPNYDSGVEWEAGVTYFIKNVGCGQYLTGANNWATQISVSSDGKPYMQFVIEELEGDDASSYPDCVKIKVEGSYKTYGGNGYENGRDVGNSYLFRDGETNGFIDHNAQACWFWLITKAESGNYYIQSAPGMGGFNAEGTEYVEAQSAGQGCLMNGTNSAKAEWLFIPAADVDMDALEKYEAAKKIYDAKLALYNVLVDATKYGASTDAAGAVFNNADATAEELTAAREELLKLMPAAVAEYAKSHGTADAPFEMPYLLKNADFSAGNIDGWTIERPEGATGNYQYQGAKYTGLDENVVIQGFIESWVPAPNHLSNGKIYQTVSGLPNGHYFLECDAMAVNQSGVNDLDNYIEKSEYTGVYLFCSDGTITMKSEALASDREETENENGDPVTIWHPAHFVFEFDLSTTAESVTIGLFAEDTNLNWMAADNFVLKYAGDPQALPSYTALVSEVSTSEAYKATDPVAQVAAIDAFNTALAEAQALTAGGADDSKDAQYQAAFSKLSNARADVAASVEAYKSLDAFIAKLYAEDEKYGEMANYGKITEKIGELIDAMEAAQTNRNLSTEEIQAAINSYDETIGALIKEIFDDLVAANEPCEPFEITSLFDHMDFPDTNGGEQESFPGGYPTENPVWMNETGTGNFKTNFGTAEVWNQNFKIYRDFADLPKGSYTIETKAFYRVAANDTNYPNYKDGAYDGMVYATLDAGGEAMPIINNAEIASFVENTTGGATLETDEGTVYIPNSQQGASEIFTLEKWAEEAEKCVVRAKGLVPTETGTLRVSITGQNLEGNSWVIWHSFRIFYNGEDASAYDDIIRGLIAQTEELMPVVEDAQGKIDAAVAAGNAAIQNDDKEGKVAAISALQDAIAYTNEGDALYKQMYDEAQSRMERIDQLLYPEEGEGFTYTNTEYPAMLDEILEIDPDTDNKPQSNEQLQTYIDRMANEWDAFVWSKEGIDDASLENPVSMGEIIANGTFKNNDYVGWTIVNPETGASMNGGTARDAVGEFWNSSVFDIHQSVKLLKNGYWRLSMDGLFRAGNTNDEMDKIKAGEEMLNELYLYISYPGFYKEVKVCQWSDTENGAVAQNDETQEFIDEWALNDNYNLGTEEEPNIFYAPNTQGEFRKYINNSDRYRNVVDFGFPTAGVTITIGLKLLETCSYNWCPFTNFDLEFLGSEIPDAINSVATSGKAATKQIFSIDGRQKSTVSRGINIVRMSDGTVSKVLVK